MTMNPCRDLRKLERVNYAAIANGRTLPKNPVNSKDVWSTKKLYELEEIDHKVENGESLLKVHNIGWNSKYNEWRSLSDVVNIPQHMIDSSVEAENRLKTEIQIAIKESLNCNRKCDSLVELRGTVAQEYFQSAYRMWSVYFGGAQSVDAAETCILGPSS